MREDRDSSGDVDELVDGLTRLAELVAERVVGPLRERVADLERRVDELEAAWPAAHGSEATGVGLSGKQHDLEDAEPATDDAMSYHGPDAPA